MPEAILTEPVETDWKSGIAEEHLGAVSGFVKDDTLNVPALVKGYGELYTKMGNSTKIPTADSPEEEVSAFYKQLGRPDAADGYTKPTLAEGEELDNEFFSAMAAIAHKGGASDTLFANMTNGFIEYANHLKAQQEEAETTEFNRHREEADRKMHEDYGADYDKNIELSKRAYTEYAGDDLKELLKTDKYVSLMNEPAFIDMLVQMGVKNMDDTLVKGDGQPEPPKGGYVPASPKSPEMYANMDGEEGVKARAYFRVKGHVYDRKD